MISSIMQSNLRYQSNLRPVIHSNLWPVGSVGLRTSRYVVQVGRSDKKPEVSWDSHCLGNVVTEWLTNWPTDWLTDWLTDRVVDWEHQWRNSTTRARLRCFLHINSKSRIRLYEETVAYIRFCQNASVQFSSRWYLCSRKRPYALHSVSQRFP